VRLPQLQCRGALLPASSAPRATRPRSTTSPPRWWPGGVLSAVAAASAATTASPSGRRIRVGESGLEAAPITLSRYDIAVRPLDERLAKLKTEREVLGDTMSQRPQRASREHWQRRWYRVEPEEKRALLKLALRSRRLIVDPPEPGTTAHYGDVTRRIRIEQYVPLGSAWLLTGIVHRISVGQAG
jgi:hypothetical protein